MSYTNFADELDHLFSCRECEIKEEKIQRAKLFALEIVRHLYSTENLKEDQLKQDLKGLLFTLNLNEDYVPSGTPLVVRKKFTEQYIKEITHEQ